MNRRGFLTFALGAAAGAVVIPELVTPTRRWFLPPAGGSPGSDLFAARRMSRAEAEQLYGASPAELSIEDTRRMRDAMLRAAEREINPPLVVTDWRESTAYARGQLILVVPRTTLRDEAQRLYGRRLADRPAGLVYRVL